MADIPYAFTLVIITPDAKNVITLQSQQLGPLATMTPLSKFDPDAVAPLLVKMNAPISHEESPVPSALFGTFTINLSMYNPEVTGVEKPRGKGSDDRKQ